MTNANDPRNPFIWEDNDGYKITEPGLTKREHFAAMAMQGILASNPPYLYGNVERPMPVSVAAEATIYADALIEALNKPVPTP